MPTEKLSQTTPAPTDPTTGDQFVALRGGNSNILFSLDQVKALITSIVTAPQLSVLPPASNPPLETDQIAGVVNGTTDVLFTGAQVMEMVEAALGALTVAVSPPAAGDDFIGVRGGVTESFTYAQMQSVFGGSSIATLPAAVNPPTTADNIAGTTSGNSVLFTGQQVLTFIESALAALATAATPPTTGDEFIGVRGGATEAFTYPQMRTVFGPDALATVSSAAAAPATGDFFIAVRGGAAEQFSFAQMQASFPGGGGGANFWTVPFSSTIAPTTRAEELRWSDSVNVKDFGALGDGVSDDTVAIQAAFNWNRVSTNAPTASGSVLHFARVPFWVKRGMGIANVTNPNSLVANNTISGVTATTITLVTPVSSAVGSGDVIMVGQTGKVFFPPGRYIVSAPIIVPQTGPTGTVTASMVIEGSGNASFVIAAPAFNGFVFDDLAPLTNRQGAGPWNFKNLSFANAYIPTLLYKKGSLAANAAWLRGDTTISVLTSSIPAAGIQPGALVYAPPNTGTFSAGGVPGYIGFVTIVTPSSPSTVLTLGDTIGMGGAQIPSGGATDSLMIVQGFFAASAFALNGTVTVLSGSSTYNSGTGAVSLTLASATTIPVGQVIRVALTGTGSIGSLNGGVTATAGTTGTTLNYTVATGLTAAITGGVVDVTVITMALPNPGLDAGYYYVWDFTKVTNRNNPIPQCIGVTSAAAWVGTTLTLNNPATFASVGASDLLVLSPVSGCVRHVSTQNGVIENCVLSGMCGIALDATNVFDPSATGSTATLETTVRNCSIQNGSLPTGSATIGQHGIHGGQSTFVENCDVNGCWVGVRMGGVNSVVTGGRAELCAYGYVLGGIVKNNITNINNSAAACVITATETEGTWCASVLQDAAGSFNVCRVDSLFVTAGHANACYGIYLPGSTSTTVLNCSFNAGSTGGNWGGYFNPSFAGPGSPAGIYIGDATNPQYMTFISTSASVANGTNNVTAANTLQTGPAWRMPTTPNAARFVNCNNPPVIYTFAALPVATTATGQISADGTGTGAAGNVIKFTTAVFANVGATITGAGVTTGTFITSMNINSTVMGSVNIAQTVSSTTLTIYPMVDSDEYLISDGCKSVGPVVPLTGADFGGTVVGGGTQHCKVRWNAQTLAWTLCGL